MASGFSGDISNGYLFGPTLANATSMVTGITTDASAAGASVDIGIGVGSIITAVVTAGAVTGTSPTLTLKMQESTDGSSNWTDSLRYDGTTASVWKQTTLASGVLTEVASVTQITTNGVYTQAYEPTKRYQRCTGTVGGTSPVFPITVCVVDPRRTAAANTGGFNTTVAAS
jgi:hypothetical protein